MATMMAATASDTSLFAPTSQEPNRQYTFTIHPEAGKIQKGATLVGGVLDEVQLLLVHLQRHNHTIIADLAIIALSTCVLTCCVG